MLAIKTPAVSTLRSPRAARDSKCGFPRGALRAPFAGGPHGRTLLAITTSTALQSRCASSEVRRRGPEPPETARGRHKSRTRTQTLWSGLSGTDWTARKCQWHITFVADCNYELPLRTAVVCLEEYVYVTRGKVGILLAPRGRPATTRGPTGCTAPWWTH